MLEKSARSQEERVNMKTIRKCMNGLLTLLFAMVILNFATATSRSSKQLLSSITTIAVASVLFMLALGVQKGFHGSERNQRSFSRIPLIMALYGVMLYVFANIYYKSGSDLWTIDYTAKVLIEEEPYIDWCTEYYSRSPNNIMLTVLYSLVLRIHSLFGVVDRENPQFTLVAVNCLISCITVVLVAKILYKLTKDSVTSGIGIVLSILYFCFNPFNVWPYSDPFSLWIPVSLVAIIVLIENAYMKIGLFTALSIFAAQIKPQNTIPVIALVCLLLIFIDKLVRMKLHKVKVLKCLCSVLVCGAIMLYGVCSVNWEFSEKVPVDKMKELSFTHFFMMGLNQKSNGGWSGEDVAFSTSISDPDKRAKANIQEAKRRLSEMGTMGYSRFLWHKLNKLCNNGTLDYSTSTGDWYDVVYPEKNTLVSPFLRSLYYYDGANYPVYYTAMNILWAFVLICCLLASVVNFRENDPIQFWLGISIMGLFLFELLFEAQARQLYSFMPLLILYGVFGINRLVNPNTDRCERIW